MYFQEKMSSIGENGIKGGGHMRGGKVGLHVILRNNVPVSEPFARSRRRLTMQGAFIAVTGG